MNTLTKISNYISRNKFVYGGFAVVIGSGLFYYNSSQQPLPTESMEAPIVKRTVNASCRDKNHMNLGLEFSQEEIALDDWLLENNLFVNDAQAPKVSTSLHSFVKHITAVDKKEEGIFAKKVPHANELAIQNLINTGATVTPVTQGKAFLQVRLNTMGEAVSKDQLKLLLPLAEQIIWLDLGRTSVSDEHIADLAQLKNLTRLHLENTKITDASIAHITGFKNLEYINLYGTEISDEGFRQLAEIKSLKSVYVWQTNVSEEGVRYVQERQPNVSINIGTSL